MSLRVSHPDLATGPRPATPKAGSGRLPACHVAAAGDTEAPRWTRREDVCVPPQDGATGLPTPGCPALRAWMSFLWSEA